MWHSFVRSQAPPCKGILPPRVHPQPQDHMPKYQEPPDISSSFHFWSNSWWIAKHVSIFRELVRGAGSWWEDGAMWGKPITLGHIKRITGMANGIRRTCTGFVSSKKVYNFITAAAAEPRKEPSDYLCSMLYFSILKSTYLSSSWTSEML